MKYIQVQMGNDETICMRHYESQKQAKASILILHGMAEHIDRYNGFASFLAKKDYDVYGYNHRGHGDRQTASGYLGHFSDQQGWQKVVTDVKMSLEWIRTRNPNKPVVLLGHSMGSFVARAVIQEYKHLEGVILIGTGWQSQATIQAGVTVAKLMAKLRGKTHASKWMDKMVFGSNNKKIKNIKTPFDWLSRDEKVVEAYIKDDLCGFLCTSSFYIDLFMGISQTVNADRICKGATQLPMLFISGEDDPVGNYGKGVRKAAQIYKDCGNDKISLKLYPNMRHEVLNEIDKEDVYADITEWMKTNIDRME